MTLQTHSTLHDLVWRRADCGHGISSSLSRSFSLTLTFVHRRSSEAPLKWKNQGRPLFEFGFLLFAFDVLFYFTLLPILKFLRFSNF